MIIGKLLAFGRRQLHTIISRETIKPSSPTPSHLRNYNLSPIDQIAGHTYVPLVLFYPNNGNCSLSAHDKAREMKRSLSQSLTQYYPFAGRLHTPTSPYIDCNDEGVLFVEAKNDSQLQIFQRINADDDSLDQLFADGLVCKNSPCSKYIVGVQLNHFACGGMAVAVSMSHVICDGCTVGSFMNYWASVTRYGSTDHKELLPLNPHFIRSLRNNNPVQPDAQVWDVNPVVRKFVFPNTKLRDLKNKVNALAAAGFTPHINNPTRVEVLSSLLYKTAVAAATKKSGCFKQSYLIMGVNLRSRFIQKLPVTTVGNYLAAMIIRTSHTRETSANVIIAEIKNQKSQLEGVQSVQHAVEHYQKLLLKMANGDLESFAHRSYWCSSICGFSFNRLDFGWGNPIDTTLLLRSIGKIGFLLKDTPDGDGIEALVILEKEDMEIFQNDKEMLPFCLTKQT